MNKTIKKLWNDEDGLGFSEYVAVLGLAAIVVMVVLTPFYSH